MSEKGWICLVMWFAYATAVGIIAFAGDPSNSSIVGFFGLIILSITTYNLLKH